MNTINSLQQVSQQMKPEVTSPKEESSDFGKMLGDAIRQVNQSQIESEKMSNQLITGEVQDVHQVMLAAQKASLSLNLTVEVRNKVIESYQEIMRMQM